MSGSIVPTAPARSLSTACGLPLAAYRRDHVQRCILRALHRERLQEVGELVDLMESEPAARSRFRRSVAVASSGLFRDPNQLRWIDRTVLPSLTAGAKRLRAWSAGCAGGEEAFTLAMMLEWHGMLGRCEIVGSDILEETLADAETGICGSTRIPGTLQARTRWDLRDLVTEGAADGEFEVVLCRNLVSLLADESAARVERTLASALSPGGVLVLGRDESLTTPAEELALTPLSSSAFRKTG